MDEEKFGILLALHTWMRIGEVCALKWEDTSVNRGERERYEFKIEKCTENSF